MKNKTLAGMLSELTSRLAKDMDLLAKSQLNWVQAAIVQELLSGRRTIAELVATIYSMDPGKDGYMTQYSRIRREIRQMESRGLVVARRPFGRDKPYFLTQLAIAKLTRIEGVRPTSLKVAPRRDMILYTTVLVLGLVLVWMATTDIKHAVAFLVLAFAFVFTGGVAFCRFIEAIARVT